MAWQAWAISICCCEALDTDSKFAGGGVLTQTDMVVRIDFVHHHVTMLSLPRDLWIPSDEGYCCNKLDAHLAQ
jgi:anionic cell wall polymer biosynthesis LytR-Cps2A-Psr (LCP) family protein